MINWNPALKAKARTLESKLSDLDNYTQFVMEVQKQASERVASLFDGLNKYIYMPLPDIAATPHKTIWQEGSTSLFDYGGKGQPILFVPSLINKSYILDLTEKTSIIHFLKDKGFRPLMLDWSEPGKEEEKFGLDEYVERILGALQKIDEPAVIAGYCMGGLMAMAAALHCQDKLKGLVLLATPWDFHSEDLDRMLLTKQDVEKFSALLKTTDYLPKELIYLMFYFLDPWPVHGKYSSPSEDESFLAREYWVHDGIKMTTGVASDCFIGWSFDNATAEKKWRVLDKLIDPAQISIPTFIGIPAYDRVVPPLCSKPLTELIKEATIASCPSGHVGMIVGKNARDHLWNPLEKWLSRL